LAKHSVVIDPHDPDREEARRAGEVRRPEVEDGATELPGLLDVGDDDLEDEQRDRDREDAVRKRLEPALLHTASLERGPVVKPGLSDAFTRTGVRSGRSASPPAGPEGSP